MNLWSKNNEPSLFETTCFCITMCWRIMKGCNLDNNFFFCTSLGLNKVVLLRANYAYCNPDLTLSYMLSHLRTCSHSLPHVRTCSNKISIVPPLPKKLNAQKYYNKTYMFWICSQMCFKFRTCLTCSHICLSTCFTYI